MDEFRDNVETLVDRYGVSEVLDMLSAVCRLKSDHCEHAWQDTRLSGQWERVAREVDKAVQRVQKLGM